VGSWAKRAQRVQARGWNCAGAKNQGAKAVRNSNLQPVQLVNLLRILSVAIAICFAVAKMALGQFPNDSIAVMRVVGTSIKHESLGAVSVHSAMRCPHGRCRISAAAQARLVRILAIAAGARVQTTAAASQARYMLRIGQPQFSRDSATLAVSYHSLSAPGEAVVSYETFVVVRKNGAWRVAEKRLDRIS